MEYLKRKELQTMLEAAPPRACLSFRFNPTFGGNFAVVRLNPDHPAGGKRYIIGFGLSLDKALESKPLWRSNKAKEVADWLAERCPVLVEEAPVLEKAV
jgi:hypothetical protein